MNHGQNALKMINKFFPKVARVQDATHRIEVEVTAKDDKESRKGDHAGCAMAVACKRKFNLDGMIVSRSTAYMVKGKIATRFRVPESVAREVTSFDRNSGFEPGEYHLGTPPPRCKVEERKAGKSNVKKSPFHVTTNIRGILKGKSI